MDALTVAKWAE
jgi:hypothetical protein